MRLRASVTNVGLLAGLLRTCDYYSPRHGGGRIISLLPAFCADPVPAHRTGRARWGADMGHTGCGVGVFRLPH